MAGCIEKGAIRFHEEVGSQIWLMQAELPKTAASAKPGQFVHLKVNDESKLFRRPLSISGVNRESGLVEVIYRVVGEGTACLSRLKVGDTLDSLGPLGTSFFETEGHVVGIGGGVGIAPILFYAREAKSGQMTAIIGGRNKKEVFWKDLFPDNLRKLIVTTDDGSYGIQGFSVSVLPDILEKENVGELITCGPAVMMRTAANMAKEAGVYCEVSLERRMGCGTGTCLACVCDTILGGHKKVCLDGPVFNAKEVVL